jgi:hypothetical protein
MLVLVMPVIVAVQEPDHSALVAALEQVAMVLDSTVDQARPALS